MITPIPSYYVTPLWYKVGPLLKPAIEDAQSGYGIEDVLKHLQVENMQLWVVDDYKAVAITQLVDYPKIRVCLLVALAGKDMSEWLDEVLDAIEEWAAKMNCAYIEEYGRKGWQRVGEKRGWQYAYTVMRKAVNGH